MKKKVLSILIIMILIFSNVSLIFAIDEGETPSGIPLNGIEEFIDDYMEQYIGKTTPGASVVLVKDGKIIFSKGYGYANIENKTKVDPAETIFEYGSVSKLFVYTTIMRLVEQGKINLHTDIREYLPEGFLKKLKYDDPITMLDIMNHTTGFEDYLFDVILTTPKNLPTMEQTLNDSQPMQVYKPGEISAYSNYAVALGAYIAEEIINQDFYEYLMETVFLPLGMNNTSAHPLLSDNPNLIYDKANGYYQIANGDFGMGEWSYIPLYPIGAVNGTAEDLARFTIALMPEDGQTSQIFSNRKTLDEMFMQTHEMGPGLTGFAHGFIEWDGEYRGLGHGGNTAFFSSQMNFVPEKRFGVIVLTNAANEMDISSGLTKELIGKRDQNIKIGTGDLPDTKDVEGFYVTARKMYSSFLDLYGYLSLLNVKTLEDNKIEMSMAGQSSTLVQTKPYIYKRISADGPIFKYNFGTVYFDVEDGKVKRMSGDFIPLPSGRTIPWLIGSLIIAAMSIIYFLIIPIILLISSIVRKIRKKNDHRNTPYNRFIRKINTLLVLCGTATIINIALLIVRMLINSYRSFSEIRIHIIINYPLITLSAILTIILVVNWKRAKLMKRQKIFYIITVIMISLLMYLLINWKFFNVIA